MRAAAASRVLGYLVSILGVVAVALLLWPFYPQMRALTAATAELIVVLLVAMKWGMGPALVSSILSAIYLNFYYVPPTLKLELRLAGGDDLVALVAYLTTSVLVGQLSSRAQRRTQQVQVLYDQLRDAFERASQLEALKQSERLKSALLDTVTHDLRTPLTSIKAAATALRDMRAAALGSVGLASIEDQMLSIIVQQTDRLNHFIQGMIEFARVQTNNAHSAPSFEATPMDDIIAAALVRAEDALQGHEVSVDCEDDLKIARSPQGVAQVLFSILENAGRYSPSGTRIVITAERKSRDVVELSIEDEGPGVPHDLRQKIFEKFFRREIGDRSSVLPVGLGLGLAIARGIVEAQGGRIWVEDRPCGKQGARFGFTVNTEGGSSTSKAAEVMANDGECSTYSGG